MASVVTEIWNQIPVSVKMCLGAREAQAVGEYTLLFAAGGRSKRYFSVTLNGRDTYDVTVYRLKRGSNQKVVLAQAEDVYNSYQKVVLAQAVDVYNESLGRVLLGMEKHLAW